jgi:hypothetical protein
VALIEPERCIAHMVRGPNKGRRCTTAGIYTPFNNHTFGGIKGDRAKVCRRHLRNIAWQRDVVERFYLGRYWE